MAVKNIHWFAGLAPVMKGSARNAAQETSVISATMRPIFPTTRDMRSALMPVAISKIVKIAWSIIRIRITVPAAMPILPASVGR